MARFSTIGTMALVADDTVLSLIAATTVRPKINAIVMSSSSAPNDYSAHFHFQRFSADGTGTAKTPQKMDFDGAAAVATSKQAYSAEPTYTANEILLNIAHNLRATVQWIAVPGYEFIVPALAGDGIGQRCIAVSTQFTEEATFFFEE